MATNNLPTPERLRQLLRYDPETGALHWRERTPDMFVSKHNSAEASCKSWNTRYSGKEAFTYAMLHGHKQGSINGQLLLAHRVCWVLHFGEWPSGVIDHIDGYARNNRISNLRNVSQSENMRNARKWANNTSGFGGVYFDGRYGTWYARINDIHLGSFSARFDAILARLLAEKTLGYTMRHGLAA